MFTGIISAVGLVSERRGNRLKIEPGRDSVFQGGGPVQQGPAAIEFRDGKIASITALDRKDSLDDYLLEPEVITTLFDQTRAKRR